MHSPEREVMERFLSSVQAVASDPTQLIDAVSFGLERVLDECLRQACREHGVSTETFSAAVERDEALRNELQERLGRVFHPDVIESARSRARHRELDRHLQVLRYALSGAEPQEWVWPSVEPRERARIEAARSAGGENDPQLLARVNSALARLWDDASKFGRCETCAEPIAADRLRALPWVERCANCQLAHELKQSPAPSSKRVAVMMFFERGRPVPREWRTTSD